MRYEVWCKAAANDVKVYESDIECEVRVLVDGSEVYHLTGTPKFASLPEPATAQVLAGGSVETTVTDSKGKPTKAFAKEWSA